MHETLDELLHRQPFRAFEIHLSNGNAYTIAHPEMAQLMKAKIVIGVPKTNQVVVCFLLHIAEVRMAGPS
jgi:hypothetical protein